MATKSGACYSPPVRVLLFIFTVASLSAKSMVWPREAGSAIERRTAALSLELNGPSTPLRLAKAIGKLEEEMISTGHNLFNWYGKMDPQEFRCVSAMIFSDPTLKPAELLAHSNLFRSTLAHAGELADAAQKAYVVQRDARNLLTEYLKPSGSLQENLRKTSETSYLDALLGIERVSREFATVDPANYQGEQIYPTNWVDLASSTYESANRFYTAMEPTAEDEIWDLGCGYGRILLYGAALYPDTKFKGVEIVGPRLDVIRQAMQSRGIKNIELFEKSVLDTDYSNGTAFFLFAPFPDRMEAVGNQLGVIGRRKRIRIMENKTRFFERYTEGEDAWLRRATNNGFSFWESIPR